jgi:uncharacterized membrane protein YfcA
MAGLGFALLIAPFLVMIMGPHEGVLMVNICAVVANFLIVGRVWRDIDWNMFWWLSIPSSVAAVVGSIAGAGLPPAPLAVGVGAIVLAALLLSLFLQRTSFVLRGDGPKAAAGFVSGVTNALAGVGGPAVSAYAVLARWPQRPFAATLQPFFIVLGLFTIATKLIVDPGQLPRFEWWYWALIVAVIIGGIFLGEKLLRRTREEHVRAAVVLLAIIGAAGALVKGLVDLAA